MEYEENCLKMIPSIEIPILFNPNDTMRIDGVVTNPNNCNEIFALIAIDDHDTQKLKNIILYRYNMSTNVLVPVICDDTKFCPIATITDIFYLKCKVYAATHAYTWKDNFSIGFDECTFTFLLSEDKDSIILIGDLYQQLPYIRFPHEGPFLCHFFCILNTTQWTFTRVIFFRGQRDTTISVDIETRMIIQKVVQQISEQQLPENPRKWPWVYHETLSGQTFLPLIQSCTINDVQCYKNFVFGLGEDVLHCWKLGSINNNYTNIECDNCFLQYVGKMGCISQNNLKKVIGKCPAKHCA